MEVGDHQAGFAQLGEQIGRHQVVQAVVVVGVGGQQDTQPVADGDAGGADQEGVRETGVLRVGQLIERLPGDQHGDHQGFAAAGGHFDSDAIQQRVGGLGGVAQGVFDPGIPIFTGYFGQVNSGFQGFDLAKEQAVFALRVGPVFQKSPGDAGNALVFAFAPDDQALAHPVDEFILFDAVGGPFGFEGQLVGTLFTRLGNGDEILAGAARRHDLVGDAVVAKTKMPARLVER